MLDGKKSKKVKIKKEKNLESGKSKKRGIIDDFVAPSAPAPKKSKKQTKSIKEEQDIPSSSSKGLIGNLLEESNESEGTKSVRTDKWGRKK